MSATSFYIAADKVAVMEVKAPAEALLSLFHLYFIYDFDYPVMPKTIEYIER